MSTIIKQRQRRTAARNSRRESPQAAPNETTRAPEQRTASEGTQARHADAQITSSAVELARTPGHALTQLLDPKDLVKLGTRMRSRTRQVFQGMFDPAKPPPDPEPGEGPTKPPET